MATKWNTNTVASELTALGFDTTDMTMTAMLDLAFEALHAAKVAKGKAAKAPKAKAEAPKAEAKASAPKAPKAKAEAPKAEASGDAPAVAKVGKYFPNWSHNGVTFTGRTVAHVMRSVGGDAAKAQTVLTKASKAVAKGKASSFDAVAAALAKA